MYDAETVVTLATYAALQDWDGIFLFNYGSRGNWDSEMVRSYFDCDQHPIKMAMMIPAYMIFVRGDVRPANYLVVETIDKYDEINLMAKGRTTAWTLIDGGTLGIPSYMPLLHRTAIVVEGLPEPEEFLTPPEAEMTGSVYNSDTGEVVWNAQTADRGVLLVNTSKSVAVIGFGGEKQFDLGNIVVEPGRTLLGTWGVITLSVVNGESFADWNSLLLVAAGFSTNNGSVIRDFRTGEVPVTGSVNVSQITPYNGEITCADSWGQAPTLAEGVRGTIRIRTQSDIEVWSLNSKGERLRSVPVSTEGEYKVFTIGAEYKTIWYEVTIA